MWGSDLDAIQGYQCKEKRVRLKKRSRYLGSKKGSVSDEHERELNKCAQKDRILTYVHVEDGSLGGIDKQSTERCCSK